MYQSQISKTFFLLSCLFVLWGCSQDQPTVTKNIPKDYESKADWILPDGWEEAEPSSNMVMAAFEITSGEHTLKFTVSSFEGLGGADLDNINRWLNQLGRSPINEQTLNELKQEIQFGHHSYLYFDLIENPPSPAENQLLTSILRVTNRSWFFKLQGHRDALRQQEPNFRSFLTSFRLQGDPKEAPVPEELTKAPPPPPPPTTVPRLPDPRFTAALSSAGGAVIPAGGNLPPGVPPPPRNAPPPPPGGFPKPPPIPPSLLSKDQQNNPSAVPPAPEPGQPGETDNGAPKWTVPQGWKSLPPTAFRVGNFLIQGENGETGEVTVIPLSGRAGSLDDNILRWGRQIGIPPEELQTDPPKQEDIQISGQTGKYVTIQGKTEGIHIGTAKHDGHTWFFKLKGKHALVEAQQANFKSFLQSVQF